MMNLMLMNKKLMITCMAYWMKAIISPTCRLLAAICLPPNQTISSDRPFITSIMKGIMVAMARFTNSVLPVRSLLAFSNRFCMKGWLEKALTRFSRSIRVCIFLKRGMATANRVRINPSITIRARASTQARFRHLDRPIIRPPMPIMGAKHIMRRPMLKKFCTWVISLVDRVIRLAPENWSISLLLK